MDFDHHHRRSVRLRDYDYRENGAYFVTICTQERETLFGAIGDDGLMVLNGYGQIVEEEWLQTAVLRPNVELDVFVVMPNHIHMIVVIVGNANEVGARRALPLQQNMPDKAMFGKPLARSLGSIVGSFKSAVSKRINMIRDTPGASIWQRNYYEHIIRDGGDLQRIRAYIENNPATWREDSLYMEKQG